MSDAAFETATPRTPKAALPLAWLATPARQVAERLHRRRLARQMACIAPRLREDAGLDLGQARRG